MKTIRLIALLLIAVSTPAQLVRETNSTLKFPTVVTSAPGQYELKDAFPNLTFDRPVCIATPPGETNRIFVIERVGRIITVTNFANPVKEVFLDMSAQVNASDWVNNRRTEGLSSIAFHPNFAVNHRFFVTYNTFITTTQGAGHHNRVSEFLSSADTRTGVLNSEIPLITQYDEGDGHNINDLHFGPDGYLYIASGDEGDGGTGDDFNNAQKIDKDFFSAIMRIDVDKKAANLLPNIHAASNRQGYKIPADNPFVGATSFNGLAVNPQNVRTEFFAVGLRNPWRFSFDPQTDSIYEGDVGQHTREEVNMIVKGGNYGWSYKEGTSPGPKTGPGGFTSIAPIYEYGTGFGADQGFSVTGGVVYRGAKIPALFGHLVFADYVSGNVWEMNIDAQPYTKKRLMGIGRGAAGFGYDPRNGDVLAVNHDQGKIMRLQFSSGAPDNVPTTLDQTGIFADLAALRPNAGIYSYDVNAPLWSDGALKKRWFSIPSGKQIHFNANTNWTFPTGSVFVKHFEIATRVGDPTSIVRLETRVIVKTDPGVYGLTYRWDTNGANATLVPDGGDSLGLYITDGATTRRQTWRFPSRSECLSCHTEAGGRVLGFNTAQMNRDCAYGSVTTNQIRALATAGFFDNAPTNARTLYALATVNDASVSRTYRVKSYLAANCSFCHQPGSSTYAAWDGRITTPLSQASIVYGPLLNSAGPGTKVITPGDTNLSAIITRMRSTTTDRMPPIGTSVVDVDAVKLINDWVMQDLPAMEWYDAWAARVIPGGIDAARDADPDGDGVSNYAEFLMGSDPLSANNSGTFKLPGAIQIHQPANRGIIIETTDEMPPTGWSVLDHPQNLLTFPAVAVDRSISNPTTGAHKYFRFRVVEP